MPRKDRAKPRSGKIAAERHFSTPDIEAALRLERKEAFPLVSSDALAARRYLAEARGIVDDIYRRYGLPPCPGRPDALFARFEGSDVWVQYKPPRTREAAASEALRNFDLRAWWELGYADFGHDSEPGFASDIAVAIPDAPEGQGNWMRAFHVGYRLATTVWRWKVEYEMRRIVNVRQPASASDGGEVTKTETAKKRQAKYRHWQELADARWRKNPGLSKKVVGDGVARDLSRGDEALRGSGHTIRQVIRRPSTSKET